MTDAVAWARAEHGVTLDPKDAGAAATAARAAGEATRIDLAALPFTAEAPSFRTALLGLMPKGDGHVGR